MTGPVTSNPYTVMLTPSISAYVVWAACVVQACAKVKPAAWKPAKQLLADMDARASAHDSKLSRLSPSSSLTQDDTNDLEAEVVRLNLIHFSAAIAACAAAG